MADPFSGDEFAYDYRSRRVERKRTKTSTGDPLVPASYGMPTATGSERIVFSGGLSVREYSGTTSTVVADYVRGSDWGGGVGGIVYTLHGSAAMSANYSYNHYNARGDVTVKSNSGEGVVYAGDYTALGSRSKEYMAANNEDWQRSNTKDEDVPGYANEGFRFRDLETGVFINRDPAGFVDGPNLYCYVGQNPWSKFDPEGLSPWDDAKSFFAGSIQGVFESNGGSTVARPSGGGSSYYRGGLATGHLLGAAQGLWEMQSGGGTMAAGGALALGGAGASGTGVGAVGGLPVALVGGAGVTAGAAVTTHGALVAMNSAGHLADDFNSAMKAEGSSPSGSATEAAKESQEAAETAVKKGSANEATKRAANKGSSLHSDKPGNLPDQLRERFPDTTFEFTKPGVKGQDVKVTGGTHPSEYPNSTWQSGVDYGDFKPATSGGNKTFRSDQTKKWSQPTEKLPYDPKTGKLN